MSDMGASSDPESDLRGIGISPRERLERIETLLNTVNEKLDNKADASAVLALALRVAAIEQNEAARVAAEKLANKQEEQFHIQMRAELDQLIVEHQDIAKKLAYYAGAIAAAVFAFEWGFRMYGSG